MFFDDQFTLSFSTKKYQSTFLLNLLSKNLKNCSFIASICEYSDFIFSDDIYFSELIAIFLFNISLCKIFLIFFVNMFISSDKINQSSKSLFER
jgi:hypothetical protein